MKNILLLVVIALFWSSDLFSQIESKLYLEDANITDIREVSNEIWVATYGHGIFMYSKKDDKWTNFSTKSQNLENDLYYCIEVNKDFVWAGSGEGLFIYDKKRDNWKKRRFAQGGQWGNWIRSLKYDETQNILWIGRFVNLTILDLSRNRYSDFDMSIGKDPKSNNFKCIELDGDSLVWFGTEAGVHVFDKKKDPGNKSAWEYINNKNGFNGDGEAVSVSDILFEGDYVWFATDEFVTKVQPEFNIGGIYRYNRKSKWDRISRTNGLPANGVYEIVRTGNQLWSGLYSFDRDEKKEHGKGVVLINRFNGNVNPIDLNKTEVITSKITRLYFDGINLWLGTDKGLLKIVVENPIARWESKKNEKDKTGLKNNRSGKRN